MLRDAHPYKDEHHELVTNNVLLTYRERSGWDRAMPVPVEKIIESIYGLQLEVGVIPEGQGETILGRLLVEAKTIELNEMHLQPGGILERQGPLAFTYAHELGHWIYDVGSLEQGTLPFGDMAESAAPVLWR